MPHADLVELLAPLDTFPRRHLGPKPSDIERMVEVLGADSLDALIDETVPPQIRLQEPLRLDPPRSESEVLADLRSLAQRNRVYRSFIGMGYYGALTPGVILRNILENPGWYTQYTPYQAEISQGRLEAMLNYQTMVMELTGMDIANASLLDEGTAAAEAMTMAKRAQKRSHTGDIFFVSEKCHPQTIDVLRTRAVPLGYTVVVGDHETYDFGDQTFGALVQYPDTEGTVHDYGAFCTRARAAGALVTVATDLLALTLLTPPGEFGADIAVGNSQRFGVPLGFGGPHAAFMSTKEDLKRLMPGRLVGVSVDAEGNPAMRLSLQTREQHIRRDKATSNICTAQVLLAVMASMYAVYHGPQGLTDIARRTHLLAELLRARLHALGYTTNDGPIFDTLKVSGGPRSRIQIERLAHANSVNLRYFADSSIGVAVDEPTTLKELRVLLEIFGDAGAADFAALAQATTLDYPAPFARSSDFLTHPVFNSYHSEHEMLRYIKRLEARDLSLVQSMIPLGSCTMKLNATTEMISVTWPEFANLHPFAPADQSLGYQELFARLEKWLAEITGFAATSLQPNAGSQGEYTGLLVIRAHHQARGEGHRTVCLIPSSAHGTNPASAVMAGMEVVVVACDENGNVDVEDLRAKADEHAERLAALMVTYPSTHGVFEAAIHDICEIVHARGGQVYMDGANMNAQVGLTSPAAIGADVCHLNLHKTFTIPHGGGGPGVGPICVAAHLARFLPNSAVVESVGGKDAVGSVSAAPWGSAGILTIPYAYIAMMGAQGLTDATKVAILNANYIAQRLDDFYPVLYKGEHGRVAHECIIDLRPLEHETGITAEDVAKRLMDFGFHAPTLSFPVAGTLMIEPTESESLVELERFCQAMIQIHAEMIAVKEGRSDAQDNPLKRAPHTAAVIAGAWARAYSREQGAFPAPWVRERKFWPYVSRIDNVYGDRHLVCACLPVEAYA
jgi:glycine dehydrogenase